jgi:DNA ligase (NAD+)
MASLDKKKPDSADKWLFDCDYVVVSNKMDGMSGGLVNDGNGNIKLYTRGDGDKGQDISYLVDYIPALKKQKRAKKAYQVRGELILPKSAFKQYEGKFANARNMMGGMLTNSNISPAFKHAKFIAYTVIEPKLAPSKAFKFLDTLGFETPDWTIVKNPSAEKLSKLLAKRKKEVDFDIDGLVISKDVYEAPKHSNPKNSIAYKDNSILETALARVIDVKWQISKYNCLKPIIYIERLEDETNL